MQLAEVRAMGEEEPPILRMRGHEDAASIYEARKSKHVDDKGMTDLEVMAEMERVLDISVTETWWCIYCFCCGNGCRPWNEDPICALRRNCHMRDYSDQFYGYGPRLQLSAFFLSRARLFKFTTLVILFWGDPRIHVI